MKGMVAPGTLFEELGFNYIGPVDGHDLPTLLSTLRNVRELKGAAIVVVATHRDAEVRNGVWKRKALPRLAGRTILQVNVGDLIAGTGVSIGHGGEQFAVVRLLFEKSGEEPARLRVTADCGGFASSLEIEFVS